MTESARSISFCDLPRLPKLKGKEEQGRFPPSMMTWIVLCYVMVNVLLLPYVVVGECRIPESWNGTWFVKERDRSLPITINSSTNTISRPGTDTLSNCSWTEDSFYVFRNVKESCSECLLIVQNHKNILYSLEGNECKKDTDWDREHPEELCNALKNSPHDQNHYYWFRSDYKPIDCPFRGSFEFSYKKASSTGICASPISHASSCMDHTKVELRYEACHDQKNSVAKDEQLTCVGEWEESGLRKFVADVNQLNTHGSTSSLQERFRCFIIRTNMEENPDNSRPSTVLGYDVGTGDEATCTGFDSPENAETILYLKKQTFGDPDWKPCSFPTWLSAHKWIDMGRTVEFMLPFHLKNRTIHVIPLHQQNHHHHLQSSPKKAHPGSLFPLSHSNLQCLKMSNVTEGDDEHIAILAGYSVGCRIDHICLQFVRRSDYIFQLYYLPWGEMTQEVYQSKCLKASISQFHKEATMVSTKGTTKPCPTTGKFTVKSALLNYQDPDLSTENNDGDDDSSLSRILNSPDSQRSEWSIGCMSNDSLEVQIQNFPSLDFSHRQFFCLDNWMEGEAQYTVVSGDARQSGTFLCMAKDMRATDLLKHHDAVLTSQDCIKLQESDDFNPETNDVDAGAEGSDNAAYEEEPVGYSQLELVKKGSCRDDVHLHPSLNGPSTAKESDDNDNPVDEVAEPQQSNSSSKKFNGKCFTFFPPLLLSILMRLGPWPWKVLD